MTKSECQVMLSPWAGNNRKTKKIYPLTSRLKKLGRENKVVMQSRIYPVNPEFIEGTGL